MHKIIAWLLISIAAAAAPALADNAFAITGKVLGVVPFDCAPAMPAISGCVLWVYDSSHGNAIFPVRFYRPTNPGDACQSFWLGKTIEVEGSMSDAGWRPRLLVVVRPAAVDPQTGRASIGCDEPGAVGWCGRLAARPDRPVAPRAAVDFASSCTARSSGPSLADAAKHLHNATERARLLVELLRRGVKVRCNGGCGSLVILDYDRDLHYRTGPDHMPALVVVCEACRRAMAREAAAAAANGATAAAAAERVPG